jgi:lipid II:glycine glycyltransferase (peptidoglycan interpeptide bridge formation enzyme)
MQIVKATPQELERLLAAEKLALPIEQSFVWQEFDRKVPGRKPLGVFFVKSDSDEIVAVATLTQYTQKGYSWVWAKHGPFFIASKPTKESVSAVLKTIAAHTKKIAKDAAFIRVTSPKSDIAIKPPIHHTMYDKTIIIDISVTDEALLAGMTRGGRYDVKKSLKSGLEFRELSGKIAAKEFDTYFSILEETATRDGFRTNSKQTYEYMLSALDKNVSLFVAEKDAKPVAWAIVTNFAGKGVYYYAAGNTVGRELCASYGLQYFVMRSLRDKGCKQYDMMGIASPDYPSYEKVTGFKKKFSHNIVDIHKTFDIPLSSKYAAIRFAKKLKEVTHK